MKLKNKYIVFMYLSMFFFGGGGGGGGGGCLLGLTIDANFDYRDSIAIVEITITILSLSWHTITILSRYYRFSTKLSLKGVYLEQSRKLSPFSAVG